MAGLVDNKEDVVNNIWTFAGYDRYLISFDDNGKIRISSRLSKDERKILGVRDGSLRRKPDKKQCNYLAHHRNKMSGLQK